MALAILPPPMKAMLFVMLCCSWLQV